MIAWSVTGSCDVYDGNDRCIHVGVLEVWLKARETCLSLFFFPVLLSGTRNNNKKKRRFRFNTAKAQDVQTALKESPVSHEVAALHPVWCEVWSVKQWPLPFKDAWCDMLTVFGGNSAVKWLPFRLHPPPSFPASYSGLHTQTSTLHLLGFERPPYILSRICSLCIYRTRLVL